MQLFVIDQSTMPKGNRLTMISLHHLLATLSSCVLVCSGVDKYVSRVAGIVDPSGPAGKAGSVLARVQWVAWKEVEVADIIEDLQRHKLSLNLMLSITQW